MLVYVTLSYRPVDCVYQSCNPSLLHVPQSRTPASVSSADVSHYFLSFTFLLLPNMPNLRTKVFLFPKKG